MKEKKVSVLIGTYNRALFIERCLEGIFNQTHKNIETIVINDASIDNTIEVLEKCKKKYGDQLTYITNETNKGIAYNSNLAYSHASGEFIALIGDDDYWCNMQKIEKQVYAFESSSDNLGVVGTWWIEKGLDFEIKKTPEEPKDWKRKLLSGGGVVCGSTPLISKVAWDHVNGFDENQTRGTDSDLFRRIILNDFRGVILPEFTTIVDVNQRRERMTSSKNLEVNFLRHITAMKYNLKKLSDYYDEFPEAKQAYHTRLAKLYSQLYNSTKNQKYLQASTEYSKILPISTKIKLKLSRLKGTLKM